MIIQRPILFSTPMVKAILNGKKTQTRRIIKDKTALEWLNGLFMPQYVASRENRFSPYGYDKDLLWVRETFLLDEEEGAYLFKADMDQHNIDYLKGEWKPSIHMPKAACRLWLEIVDVRAERLQDISEHDAIEEGVLSYTDVTGTRYKDYLTDPSGYGDPDHDFPTVGTAVESYATLWEKINGPGSWAKNDWVWVVEFKRAKNPN